MPNLSLDELKQISKMRRIKGYKSISKETLLSALDESERNFNNARTKKIREDFNNLKDKILKPKLKKLEETFTKRTTKRIFLNQK